MPRQHLPDSRKTDALCLLMVIVIMGVTVYVSYLTYHHGYGH